MDKRCLVWDPGPLGPWALGPLGTLGPWVQGILGAWDLGTLGPWGPWALGPLGPLAPGCQGPWDLGTLGPWASPTQALFGEIMHTQASEGADDALMSHVHALT